MSLHEGLADLIDGLYAKNEEPTHQAANFRDWLRDFYVSAWRITKTLPAHRWGVDPNAIEWHSYMTPIEQAVWSEIREHGVVMYPQHPVGNYFVDFGHPLARIAIECDGKQFHQDKEKDVARQREIEAKGWRVYRISGSMCMRQPKASLDDESGEEVVELSPAAELVDRLARQYKLSARYA